MKWIGSLFGLCDHRWKLAQTYALTIADDAPKRTVGVVWVLRCEHCGKVKSQRVCSI